MIGRRIQPTCAGSAGIPSDAELQAAHAERAAALEFAMLMLRIAVKLENVSN